MTPTRRCAVLIALIAFSALFVSANTAFAALLIVGVALTVDAIFARRPISLKRAVPSILIIGQPTSAVVTAHGATPQHSLQLRQPRTPDLRIEPAQARARLDFTITALRRGTHALPSVAARRTGPLGLTNWDFRGDGAGSVVVYPDVPNALRIAHAVKTRSFVEAGEVRRGPLGLGTEFETIRDYQPDDDVRQINWNATIRAGRPMSNQYRVETERQVICLVDCGRLMAAPVGDLTRLDIAIDTVAAVAHVADVLGDRSGVIAFDSKVIRNLADRRRGANAVVHAIHALEPSSRDSDYDLAFRTVRNTKRALIVVLTDLLDEAAATSLVNAVPILARRHAVIVCSVIDPEIAAALNEPPSDDQAMYRTLAALDMTSARDRVRHKLIAAGARVVEAQPSALSAATVRSYLTLKDSAKV